MHYQSRALVKSNTLLFSAKLYEPYFRKAWGVMPPPPSARPVHVMYVIGCAQERVKGFLCNNIKCPALHLSGPCMRMQLVFLRHFWLIQFLKFYFNPHLGMGFRVLHLGGWCRICPPGNLAPMKARITIFMGGGLVKDLCHVQFWWS